MDGIMDVELVYTSHNWVQMHSMMGAYGCICGRPELEDIIPEVLRQVEEHSPQAIQIRTEWPKWPDLGRSVEYDELYAFCQLVQEQVEVPVNLKDDYQPKQFQPVEK